MSNRIKSKLNNKNNNFFKNLLILISGSTLAQLITILISPILTRIYSPEEFGEFAIFMAIISILTVVITLRFEIAIISPQKDEDAASILYLSIFLTSIISCIIFIALIILNKLQLINFWTSNASVYIFLIPFSMLLLGTYNSLRYWNIRKQNYFRTTRSQLGNSVSTNISQVTIGFLNILQSGLVLGKVIGLIVSGFIIGLQFLKEDYRFTKKSINFIDIKRNFINYYQYPLYNVPQALLNSLSINLIPILIGILYNSMIVGVYALTIRVLFVPVGIVGNAFKDVFFQRATELNSKKIDLELFYKKSLLTLTFIFVPFSLVFLVWGPQIFSTLFGEEWTEAGEISRWVSIWVIFIMISRPAVALIQIFGKQGLNLKIELVSSILKISFFIIVSLITHSLMLSLISLIFINVLQYLTIIYIGVVEIKNTRNMNSTSL
ncbi:lipopolysaccharide biosynthesis protein [Planococcus plakortidis]|uniref:lipopolysaccharide biosynthesis protein n=1 Tax=Planococcus plakortidis TaxID=1038856 RepID=UPI0039851405